ncbi:elongation factor G [Parendozoicomonas haliclonae]|uniref:Elongation factor G n=1 Tax=Parendozoicomonas haliclonae TaxID=1960125 RepID=A0A1X7AJ75_9GAMM|nr:elongation factor G [Parendozoicomonas haliclonae]SMA45459.1 Elongation factor G [Parendozoicomonas haliclonae]
MTGYTSDQIRNIALLGHAGSGKTSLAEALLYHNGSITAPGSIEGRNTVSDFTDLEKQAAHSLETSVLYLPNSNNCINLLDTPGFPDLFGRAIAALPAVETVALVINARNGIEPVTRYAWQQLKERHKCGLIVINHMDEADDLEQLVEEIKATFGNQCLPINLPTPTGIVTDCYFDPDESITTSFSSIEDAHRHLVEQVIEVDEELMDLYLEQGEIITVEQLHAPFEAALRENHLVPICFTAATTGQGVELLLKVLSDLMPTPLEGNPPLFVKGTGDDAVEVSVVPETDQHVIAHTFKLNQDPFAGKLGTFRIHQGIVRNGSQLFIGLGRKPIRITQLVKLQGKEQIPVQEAYPGDICAIPKADALYFDAVLHDSHDEDDFHLRPLNFPAPVASQAVVSANQGDEQKVSEILQRMCMEDPSLKLEHRERQNETVLLGLGELHLKTVFDKMSAVYKLQVKTYTPSIAYRETITRNAEGHHRHKKQNGGAGQFGEVFLRIEPLQRGEGFEFVDAVVGGAIPGQFIPAVEKGVREVMSQGAVAGYPIQDVRVTVYDGKHHPVDSKEIAFVQAGKKAFIEAMHAARPILLEPFVAMDITVPQQAMGDITGDLSTHRGVVSGTDASGQDLIIHALAPLASVHDYSNRLKAISAGEGSYTLAFSHYDPVPATVQKELISAWLDPDHTPHAAA